ncbi:MAG: universal stress protein [Candidatus Hydrogenedentes bacterium]|nr:universal stress protein [Candidatus Hydrogenedentota bacterium]
MFRQSNILMPTDFSHYALYAMRYAVAIAKRYGGSVHVAHVLDSSLFAHGSGHGLGLTKADLERLMASMEEHAESRLAHLVRIAREDGVPAEKHIARGKPAAEIIRLADEAECDMIAIATHGRTGVDHIVFGSVAEKVVRQAPVPVLSIKHPEHEFVHQDEAGFSFDLERILFPTDFSELSNRALPYAASLCRRFDATLVLLHASEVPIVLPEFMPDTAATVGTEMEERAQECLERMRGELEGIRVEPVAKTGVAYREICQTVQEDHVDLVVMPTHGRSGFGHVLFGSVAEKVVRLARCPVLTVRPEGAAPDTVPVRDTESATAPGAVLPGAPGAAPAPGAADPAPAP